MKRLTQILFVASCLFFCSVSWGKQRAPSWSVEGLKNKQPNGTVRISNPRIKMEDGSLYPIRSGARHEHLGRGGMIDYWMVDNSGEELVRAYSRLCRRLGLTYVGFTAGLFLPEWSDAVFPEANSFLFYSNAYGLATEDGNRYNRIQRILDSLTCR